MLAMVTRVKGDWLIRDEGLKGWMAVVKEQQLQSQSDEADDAQTPFSVDSSAKTRGLVVEYDTMTD